MKFGVEDSGLSLGRLDRDVEAGVMKEDKPHIQSPLWRLSASMGPRVYRAMRSDRSLKGVRKLVRFDKYSSGLYDLIDGCCICPFGMFSNEEADLRVDSNIDQPAV